MSVTRLEAIEDYPLQRFIKDHPFEIDKDPLERFLTLDFRYLAANRLDYQVSKYDPTKTDFSFKEPQLPGKGIFEIEGRKILNLIDVCDARGMGSTHILRLFPAIHICFYTHQLQFRETGEPYTIHGLNLAIKAVRDYGVDWKTAALLLIHDVKEEGARYKRPVPDWMVKYVYCKLSDKLGYTSTSEALGDAQFLVRGMEATHKAASYKNKSRGEKVRDSIAVLTRREGLPEEVESVKKVYSAILGDERRLVENANIALVKPLDRENFLETAAAMPPEKRREKAQEALLIHARMAEAFHLYDLRDRIARLALGILDPDECVFIDILSAGNIALKEKLEENNVANILLESLRSYGVIHVQFSIPGFLQMYNFVGETEQEVKPIIQVSIVTEFSETKTFDREAVEETIRSVLDDRDILIDVELISKRDFIFENASILDLYPNRPDPILGTKNEWRIAAIELLEDIRQRFKGAKQLNDFSFFLEATVSGQKMVIDRKHNNRILLPYEATLFDALFIIYGSQVFRSLQAHIKIGKVVSFVSNEDFGMPIPSGMELLGLEVLSEEVTKGLVSAHHIRKSRHLGVRKELIKLLEEEAADKAVVRKYIIEDGYNFLGEDYEKAWLQHIGNTPDDMDAERVLPLNVEHMRSVIPADFRTSDEFAYAVASGKVRRSLYRRIIREMVRFREDVIFFSFKIKNPEELKKIQRILDEYGIQFIAQQTIDTPHTAGQEHMIWFHESQLGDIDERLKRFNELFQRFIVEGVEYCRNANWNKIPIGESPLPEVQEVQDLVQEI